MKEKKRVLLSGREPFYIEPILESTDWIIELLVVDDFTPVEKFKNCDRIHRILVFSDLLKENAYSSIDFTTLQKYMYSFQMADYGSRRLNDDINFTHYDFFLSIAYWNSYFTENHIDICIISNHYHAYKCDYVVQEIAKAKGIPCYNIFNHNAGLLSLYDANRDKLVKIDAFQEEDFRLSVRNSATYAERLDLESYFVKDRGIFAKITYALGGVSLYRECSLLKNKWGYIGYKKVTYQTYKTSVKNYKKTLQSNKRLYKKVSDENKFLVYFLHLEPEAVVTSMTNTVVSQLFFIDMLSKALPKGWFLYVKEHPDSYKLNTGLFDELLGCADTYITPYFYEKIVELKNVKLIDYKIPADELIAKCEAMSTIAGTVIFEGIRNRKPIVLFANNRSVYKMCRDFMFPSGLRELKEMLSAVEQGFVPDYSDYDKIGCEYLAEMNETGRKLIISRIRTLIVEGEVDNA